MLSELLHIHCSNQRKTLSQLRGKSVSQPGPPVITSRITQSIPACWQVKSGRSLTLAEEKDAAAKLRQDICREIEKRRLDIEPFLETDLASYVAHMSQASTWGGEPELSVAPHCLQRPVDVYMNGATGLQVMSSYLDSQYEGESAVKVLFNGIGHYDLLINRQQTSKL